jgi:NADP-dependent 3-hydroxy acid dehydrogenase YdfG
MISLTNRTAIVTGVSKGIGRAIVGRLLEAKCKVAGIGRQAPDLSGPGFHFVQADVGNPDSAERAFSDAFAWLGGKVDILVNNAGLGYFRLLENITTQEWHEMMNTNVNGMFYLTRLAVPVMKKQKSGHVVNISSIAGLMGLAEATGYSATKFAIRGFSQSLLKEVRTYGIRVSCVFPGSVNTDFFEHYDSMTANETMLSADDVASTVLHVLSMPPNADVSEVEIRPLNSRSR